MVEVLRGAGYEGTAGTNLLFTSEIDDTTLSFFSSWYLAECVLKLEIG
jgi:hypothetical protein